MKIDRLLLKGFEHLGWRTGLRRQVRQRGPTAQQFFYPPYRKAVSGVVSILRFVFPDRYTDADPFKILWVDPSDIIFKTQDHFRHRGWVVSGDWDRQLSRIDESVVYRCLRRRFIQGKSWKECGYVDYVREQIQSDAIAWGLSSDDQIEKRCVHLDNLWESISNEGYKTQEEIIQKNPEEAFNKNVDEVHPRLNEIGIDIGRDGELLWNRVGYHRLILAKLIDVDRIPVLVYRRHRQWQDVREGFMKVEPSSATDTHPDLIQSHQ